MRKTKMEGAPAAERGGSGAIRHARRSLALAVEALGDRADAVLVRTPLLDPHLPETSDLDLLAVGDVDDYLPERLQLGVASTAPRRIDLIWLPRASLEDVPALARLGLVGHRILSSEVVTDRSGYATERRAALQAAFYDPKVQTQRIEGFLEMGFLTVQEIGVTWDFPELALFWIHMAYAACLAAILDGARALCPNVYTRPFDSVVRAEAETGLSLEGPLIEALRLDAHVGPLAIGLRRVYEIIVAAFPEPTWPDCMRQLTRFEYRYFSSRTELEWRISVAEEMTRRGFHAAAVFYLRFWAYSVARLPMVHQRALEGRDVSFVRPSRAVRPELERLCPEILDELPSILGGDAPLTINDVNDSLEMLYAMREQTLEFLRARGVRFSDLKAWRPYELPQPAGETGGR